MQLKILKSLELAFRHMIIYPVLRIVLGNKPHSAVIDLNQVDKILIFRQDRIGDMIISTPIFRKLKKEYPHLKLYVLASASNAEIVQHDPNIDHLIINETGWLKKIKQIKWLRDQKFDVLLNFIFNRTTTIGILARLICPKGIKVGQGPEKYKFYFNHFHTLERGEKHTCELYNELVEKAFGIHFTGDEYPYQLFLPDQITKKVNNFFKDTISANSWGKFILLNISAAETEKSLTADQSEKIAYYLAKEKKLPVLVISAPWDTVIRDNIIKNVKSPLCKSFPENGTADLLDIAEIVNRAAFVVTPDTSIIHFASAMQTPVIGIYTPLKYTAEWYPFKVENIMVTAEPDCPVSDINTILIFKEIDKYIHDYLQ